MKPRVIVIVATLVCAALSVSFASAQAPRIPPGNDTAANALSIALNAKYKIENVDLATLEIGETACGGSDPHSVWFTFTAPFTGNIAISTAGSKLVASSTLIDANTVVSLHSPTADGSDQIVCNGVFGGAGGQIANVAIALGQTYYIRVATINVELLPGSSYKLRTKVNTANYDIGLQDIGFEETPSAWTVKKALNGDGVVCGTAEAYSGDCAFKFIGGASEATSVQQTVVWPSSVLVGLVDQPVLGSIRLNRAGTSINLKVTLKLVYSDGTPVTKVNVSVRTASVTYEFYRFLALMESPNLAAVKLQLKNKSTNGTVLVDTAYLYYAGGITRDGRDGLLAVPPALQ